MPTPYRTPLQDLRVTSGDEIRADDGDVGTPLALRAGDSTLGGNDGGAVLVQGGTNIAGVPGDTDGGSILLEPGLGTGAGAQGIVVVGGGSGLQFTAVPAMPGPAITGTAGRLWMRTGTPNELLFTDSSGDQSLNAYASAARSVRDYGAVGDGVADDTAAIQAALDAAAAAPGPQTVLVPRGSYRVSATINHPANVSVRGVGPASIIRQSAGASPVWRFPVGVATADLADVVVIGQGAAVGSQVGIGISITQSLFVTVRRVQVWYFVVGVDLSDGTPYSAHNTIGPRVTVNVCTTALRALANNNANVVTGCRFFYCYGTLNDGCGIDIEDAGGLTIQGCNVDGADTCIRIRGGGNLQCVVSGCFFEPGANPVTTEVGQAADVEVDDVGDGLAAVQGFANTFSTLRSHVRLPPSGLHQWDGYTEAYFGARTHGAAIPRRNFVRNGQILYYNAADIPEWSGAGAPSIAEDRINFVTGVRSLRVTANGVGDSVSVGFRYPDEVAWITVGIRYQVVSGVGAFMAAQSGGNIAHYADPNPSGGVWQIAYIQVRRDPAVTTGAAVMIPDAVDGTGEILVDEAWAYAGRYAAESTLYGERFEMLDAPIPVASNTGVTGVEAFGPVDLTTLDATLPAPFADFSTAPVGVLGGIYRVRMLVTGASGVLATPYSVVLDVPGATGVVGATTQGVTAVYGDSHPHETTVFVRSTSLSGTATGVAAYDYEVALVGWILS